MSADHGRAGHQPGPAVLQSAERAGRTVLLEHEVYALSRGGHRRPATPARDRGRGRRGGLRGARLRRGRRQDRLARPPPQERRRRRRPVPERARGGARGRGACPRRRPGRRAGARIDGALVVERIRFRASIGREVLASFRYDPAFGAVVVLGVGGLDTEALLGSLRPERARAMLVGGGPDRRDRPPRPARDARARGRDRPPALEPRARGGAERLVELALALAQLATGFAGFAPAGGLGLSELEANPMVVAEDGRVVALDGLARLHRPKPLLPSRPVAELRRLLVPQSALVVGASAEGMNPGRIILRNHRRQRRPHPGDVAQRAQTAQRAHRN